MEIPTFRVSKILKTIGLPESHLDALVEPVAIAHPKVSFGFRTLAPENHLKLLAQDTNKVAAIAALEKATEACRKVLDRWLFGEDDQTLDQQIGQMLRVRAQTIAIAESCTGGLIAQMLTATSGASEYFLGGLVAYTEQMKQRWLGVPEEMLARHGAVSQEVALAMANGVRAQSGATYGLSTTGFAGPSGGTAVDPVGTVYCALATEESSLCERHVIRGDRDYVRKIAASLALDMLRRRILERASK